MGTNITWDGQCSQAMKNSKQVGPLDWGDLATMTDWLTKDELGLRESTMMEIDYDVGAKNSMIWGQELMRIDLIENFIGFHLILD